MKLGHASQASAENKKRKKRKNTGGGGHTRHMQETGLGLVETGLYCWAIYATEDFFLYLWKKGGP